MKRKELSNENKVDLIFIFIIIYVSNSMYFQYEITGLLRNIIIISFIIFLIFIKKCRFDKISILLVIMLLSINIISMLVYGLNFELGIGSLLTIITAFMFTNLINEKSFNKNYVKLIYFTCVYSSIIYFIYIIFPSILKYFPDNSWHMGISFKNFILTVLPTSMDNIRNFGFFPEPGIFQIYINYAVMIELFIHKNLNVKRLAIYFITIITTKSTTGIIIIMIIMIAFFINNSNNRGKKVKLLIIFSLVVLLSFILLKDNKNYIYVFEKITKMTGDIDSVNSSGGERLRAMLISLKLYFENPILGVGIVNCLKIFGGRIMTFTPLNWFAIYGTIYGITCNYMYLKTVLRKDIGFISKILLIISMIFVISTQNMSANMFVFIIIFYNSKKYSLSTI